MSTPRLNSISFGRFVSAAAAAYRATGVPEAIGIGDRLDGHARKAIDVEAGATPATVHLAAACAAPDAHPAVAALGPTIANLPWTEGTLPVPKFFKNRYAYTVLVGPEGPIADPELYFGLYLQAPDAYYPKHWHLAEELYYVLSGTAEWQQGSGPSAPKPPGMLVHHRSNEPHIMQTRAEPLLAMWAWIGDLRDGTYRIEDA